MHDNNIKFTNKPQMPKQKDPIENIEINFTKKGNQFMDLLKTKMVTR